jgi:hypothetical protein
MIKLSERIYIYLIAVFLDFTSIGNNAATVV